MYRVTIKGSGKKAGAPVIFDFEDPTTAAARELLNDLSDYLYDLDLDFDVDMDGDMLIDDILMAVTDGEPFEIELGDNKAQYTVTGVIGDGSQ